MSADGTPQTGGPPPTAFGHRGRRLWVEIGLVVGGIVLLGWLLVVGGRHLAGSLATSLPYSVDRTLGGAAAEMMLSGAEVCTNPALTGAVNQIVDRLVSGLEADYRQVEVRVLRDDLVNAFALPGGYVFVMTGLLAQVESAEELAGVLGHELGHVAHRHGLRRVAESLWVQVLLALVFADTGIAEQLAGHAAGLLSLQYGRDQERESDTFGVELLARVGIDPGRLPDFFERIGDQGVPAWLSTHPSPEDRVRTLKELAAGTRVEGRAELPTLEALRAPCHP